MKVGDLVRSVIPGGRWGIVVGWQDAYRVEPQPVVYWNDKLIHWVKATDIEVISEGR